MICSKWQISFWPIKQLDDGQSVSTADHWLWFMMFVLWVKDPIYQSTWMKTSLFTIIGHRKCWDWDIFRLTHEDKTERSVSFRQETWKKTFLQSYWTTKNTEIRIFLGLHMMIRESFWHKTLFTNQPNEDVSIYNYLTIFLCWHIKIKPKCSVSLSGKRPY